MAVKYCNPAAIDDTGNGTDISTPKKYPSSITTADEIRYPVTPTTLINGCTCTKNNTTISLPAGHGCVSGDIMSKDLKIWFKITVSGNSATIDIGFHLPTGSYDLYKITPLVTTNTTAQNTVNISGSTQVNPLKISGGWVSNTVQIGITALRMATQNTQTGIAITAAAVPCWLNISNFILVDFSTGLSISSASYNPQTVQNCSFVSCVSSSISIGNYYPTVKILGCYYHNSAFIYFQYSSVPIMVDIIIVSSAVYLVGTPFPTLSINGLTIYYNNASAALFNYAAVSNNSFDVKLLGILDFVNFGSGTTIKSAASINLRVMDNIISLSAPMPFTSSFYFGRNGENRYGKNFLARPNSTDLIFIGSLLENKGDSNFTVPSGYSSVAEIFYNVDVAATKNIRTLGANNYGLFPLVNTPKQHFKKAGTYTDRLFINSKINNITQLQIWAEVIDPSNETLLGNSIFSPKPAGSTIADYTQFFDVQYTLHADGVSEYRLYAAFYSATLRVAVCGLCYTPDSGNTWIPYTQDFDDGKISWEMAQKTTTADKILSQINVTNNGQLITGTLVVPAQKLNGEYTFSPGGSYGLEA